MSDQQRLDVGLELSADPEDRSAETEPPRIDAHDREPIDYPGGDYGETRYFYTESLCENHPNPPGNSREDHFHGSAVVIDGTPDLEQLLSEKLESVECSACDGD